MAKNKSIKKVLRRLCCATVALLSATVATVSVCAGKITDISQVVSDAYIVMDAQTGQVLIQKNAEKLKYPASITKIMTLALALQNGDLQDTITVSTTAVDLEYNVSHVALQPGEIITVQDAVMATLLASANDAANCLAEYVSGSSEAFADLMNQIAKQIGCTNTHFVNANGLPDDDHYTSAHDMARITAWALTVPGFREVFSTDSYTMQPTNLQPQERRWATQNSMFVYSAFQYEGAWGGKLGWTEQANHTMVTTLTCKDRDLILVTMDCHQKYQKYWDAICILDTVLENLEPLTVPENTVAPAQVPVFDGEKSMGTVTYEQRELTVWVPAGATVQQLICRWQIPDKLDLWDTSPLNLTVTVPQNNLTEQQVVFSEAQSTREIEEMEHEAAPVFSVRETKGQDSPGKWVIVPAVLLALVFLAFCVRWYNKIRKTLRKKRQRNGTGAGRSGYGKIRHF